MAQKTRISDEDYWKMSSSAYDKVPPGAYDGASGSWEVVEPKGTMLHDSESGFDAVVFRNKDTKQVVVGFRGTEGSSSLDRSLPDFKTDLNDVVLGKAKDLEERFSSRENIILSYLDPRKNMEQDIHDYKHNQFRQADVLVRQVKEEYPEYEVTLTGHSLGGGLAQYAGAKNGVGAVTYSAPSVTNLLPDKLAEKAKNGEFDDKIINYVHPSDSIGAGPLKEYDSHVGSTYYLGEDFKTANSEYKGIKGRIKRFIDTISGDKNFHSLDQYKFDKDGDIKNELINRATGEKLTISPRALLEGDSVLLAGMSLGGGLVQAALSAAMGGLGGGKLIALRPEELSSVARTLEQHVGQFHDQAGSAVGSITKLIHTSQSKRIVSIAENTTQELTQMTEWYATAVQELAGYIDRKANEFKAADLA